MIKKWLAKHRLKMAERQRADGYKDAAHQLLVYRDDHGEMARIRDEASNVTDPLFTGDYYSWGMQSAVADWDQHVQRVYDAGRNAGAAEALKHGSLAHTYVHVHQPDPLL